MKIQQMAFMLIAVTIFFVLVGLFLLGFAFSGLKKSATALEEENSLLLVTRLANSPEFSCGDAFDNAGSNCVDADKVMVLSKESERYSNFWGKEIPNIEIVKVYPYDGEKICNEGNYPSCSTIKVFSGAQTGYYRENFISLCRKASENGESYDKCEIAKLRVGYSEVGA